MKTSKTEIAIIGSDGTRYVAFGVGRTRDLAERDARRYDPPYELYWVEITSDQAAKIRRGYPCVEDYICGFSPSGKYQVIL